jgi:hypothetical protein
MLRYAPFQKRGQKQEYEYGSQRRALMGRRRRERKRDFERLLLKFKPILLPKLFGVPVGCLCFQFQVIIPPSTQHLSATPHPIAVTNGCPCQS